MKCKICESESSLFETALVLQKYVVKYYRCSTCGFIQTEEPYWLGESYSNAIVNTDSGYAERNYRNAALLNIGLRCFYPQVENILDYGRGYGLLVRLMRDRGFNFYGYDKYCVNLFSQEFDANMTKRYDFLVSFEVFEHLLDPMETMKEMVNLSGNILLSTLLVPTPAPSLNKWEYYGLQHGQHIAFHTQKSMELLAKKNGLNFKTNGHTFHVFSKEKISPGFVWLTDRVRLLLVLDSLSKKRLKIS